MFKNLTPNLFLIFLLSLLASCDPKNKCLNIKQIISTHFADKLNITTIDNVEQLKGGASGSQLFKIYANGKTYVERIIKNRTLQQIHHEIICQEIASKCNYGPKVYATDINQEMIIMDFIERDPITAELRDSEILYVALGTFLKTMHTGPRFPLINKDNYKVINTFLKELKQNSQNKTTIQRIKNIMLTIQSAVQHFPHLAPCHNDLNPENLFYTDGKFLAIDFESARQDDPYFDVATVSIYNCFNPQHEQILLNTYFQRPMSMQKESKYYLVKQLAFIFIALSFIRSNNLKSDVLSPGMIAQAPSLEKIIEMIMQGTMNVEIGHEQERSLIAQSMLKKVFINAESQEFKDAVKCLITQDK